MKHNIIDPLECFTRQLEARDQRLHHLDGFDSRRRRVNSTERRPDPFDQVEHNFGVNRETRMDCFVEQLHI